MVYKKPGRTREDVLAAIAEAGVRLNSIQDIDILLENILSESRAVVNADAGSIYVIDSDMLSIRYAQNDTIQKTLPPGKKMIFSYFSFPLDEKTIAGYAAVNGCIVNEPDVYTISSDSPYKFGRQSDLLSGYRTRSNLSLPLKSGAGRVLGVLQVLNALDGGGNVVPFDKDDEIYLSHFAASAAFAIERTQLIRSMISRMIKMAEFRDPKETGAHVNRVSSYAVEIYDRWAFNHGVAKTEASKYRDLLKIAAMLHDVGKVAVSDVILKKPGKLSEEEVKVIQSHTRVGASLFGDVDSALDSMARDVALFHHENWDGTGYPGRVDLLTGKPLPDALLPDRTLKPILGEDIPLAGRIVAVADVFDALSCKRAYKEKWPEEKVFGEIRAMSGKKFDPEVVDAFFEILPQIKAIQNRYPDDEPDGETP